MQRKRPALVVLSVLFIVMFIVSEVYTIQLWTDTANPHGHDPNNESNLSDSPIPREAFSLKDLVTQLLEVTPNNAEDDDEDGLPNSVEAVIGTDANSNDTDFDQLLDAFEVFNDLDPLEPDSNFDGIPDNHEFYGSSSQDIDGDGILNAWDFDNDGDNVEDSVDLSPFNSTDCFEEMSFDIETNGNPMYMTFQLVPEDPSHLSLISQTWDWPYDIHGNMMDVHRQPDSDVFIIPMLQLSISTPPEQMDVLKYGISITPEGVELPLFPVEQYGKIVAYSGRLVYPEYTPLELSITAKLIWKVFGQSDQNASALAEVNLSRNLSVASDGLVYINEDGAGGIQSFQWIDLGNDKVAIKLFNGNYLSVDSEGNVAANGEDIGINEMFLVVEDDPNLGTFTLVSDSTNRPLALTEPNVDWQLTTDEGGAVCVFDLQNAGFIPETRELARYDDSFMLTGLLLEEDYGAEAGIFYCEEPQNTTLSEPLMDMIFLRNTSISVFDIKSEFAHLDRYIHDITQSFNQKDEALSSIVNYMIPTALDSLLLDTPYSFITCLESFVRTLDLSDFVRVGESFTGITNDVNITSMKVKQTIWQFRTIINNEVLYQSLDTPEIMEEIESWGLDDETLATVMSLSLYWLAGENVATDLSSVNLDYSIPLEDLVNWAHAITDFSISVFTLIRKGLIRSIEAYRIAKRSVASFQSMIEAGWRISIQGKQAATSVFKDWKLAFKSIGKAKTSLMKSWKSLGGYLDFIAIAVDAGITIYGVIAITQGGLDPLQLTQALLKTLMGYIKDLMLIAISMNPYGAAFVAIFSIIDLILGWCGTTSLSDLIGMLFDEIIDAISSVDSQVYPLLEYGDDQELIIDDWTNNGVTVGDRLTFRGILRGLWYGKHQGDVDKSDVYPYYLLETPLGSSSDVGLLYDPIFVAGIIYNWENVYLPIPSSRQTTDWSDASTGTTYYFSSVEYDSGVWAVPNTAMPNFPMNIRVQTFTQLYYEWTYWLFCVPITHHSHQESYDDVGSFTIYIDVLPDTIDAFADWRLITPLDLDCDGLLNSEETVTNFVKFDSDGDQLGDKFELEIGSNPLLADSDMDGLNDKYELVYHTNLTNPDSDFDGVRDYLEISGDTIQFNYLNDPLLPFTIIAHSNPLSADTDSDLVNDFIERRDGLNPCSQDTNGDSVIDVEGPPRYIEFEEEWTTDRSYLENEPLDITVDNAGYIYVTDINNIIKYNPDGSPLGTYGPAHSSALTTFLDGSIGIVNISSTQNNLAGVAAVLSIDHRPVSTLHNNLPSMAVDDDGNTMVVGDPGRNLAFIYEKIGGVWTYQTFLSIGVQFIAWQGGATKPLFGYSVAISGDGGTIVVGAPTASGVPESRFPFWWDVHDNNPTPANQGAAYIFKGSGSNWVYKTALFGPLAGGLMGACVAIQGDSLSTGGMEYRIFTSLLYIDRENDVCSSVIEWCLRSSGNIYPYAWLGGAINPYAQNPGCGVVPDPEMKGRWIYSLKIENDPGYKNTRLTVGAYNFNDYNVQGSPAHKGIVRKYYLDTYGRYYMWGYFPDGPITDWYESSLLWWPDNYEYWEATDKIGPSQMERDQFGFSHDSVPGKNIYVVGAPFHEHTEFESSTVNSAPGFAYVYETDGYTWYETRLEVPGLADESEFGCSVAIDNAGNTIVVGAPGYDSNSGAAFIFEKIGTSWKLMSKITNPLPIINDVYGLGNRFGQGVQISPNGKTVWVNTLSWLTPVPAPQTSGEYFFEFNTEQTWQSFTRSDPLGNIILTRGIPDYSGPHHQFWGMASGGGSVYLSCFDGDSSNVRKYSQSTWNLQDTFGWSELEQARGIDVGSNGLIYVADYGGNKVCIFDSSGVLANGLPPIFSADGIPLNGPTDVAVDAEGNIYVTDTGNNRVVKFNDELIWQASLDVGNPLTIDVDDDGYIYVANSTHIIKFSETLIIVRPELDDDVTDWDQDELSDTTETDGWIITITTAHGTDVHVNSSIYLADSDFDTISDYDEWLLGSNPQSVDTDEDGVLDPDELRLGLNINHYDSDLDTLDDGTELNFGSDPLNPDVDGDGLLDPLELQLGTDPRNFDTDHDGASDKEEYDAGTNPLSPDSDHDFIFDGTELLLGTDPWSNDSDNDMLLDYAELYLGTNPIDDDSDHDNVTDGLEVLLHMNPLCNDTDNDGSLDGVELEAGTSPLSNYSNPEMYDEFLRDAEVVLVYDESPESILFGELLSDQMVVSNVTLEEFFVNYRNASWIILIGNPYDVDGTVGSLIADLLVDCGDTVDMLASGELEYVVRYGVWNETQTIIMFYEAQTTDVFRVINIFNRKNVSVYPDSVFLEYSTLPAFEYAEGQYSVYFMVNEIDTLKHTDAVIQVSLNEVAAPEMSICRYDDQSTPFILDSSTGLMPYEYSLGTYLDTELIVGDGTQEIMNVTYIKLYYRTANLDRTGDGLANDMEDLDESKIGLYWLDESTGMWEKLSVEMDWVVDCGVNTTDVVLFGESYAGYVWAYVKHLSLFGAGAETYNQPPNVTLAVPSVQFLWPPNGKFVEISIEGVTDPDGDEVTITILNITSDECVGRWPDAYGVGDDTARLRAERAGCGNGRVYEITFLASDGRGGETIGSVLVYVPHNKKKHEFVVPIDDGQNYDATKGKRPYWLYRKCRHLNWEWLWNKNHQHQKKCN